MDFATLKEECFVVLRDPTVETSIPGWLNDVVLELAAEFEIPALRLPTPAQLATTTAAWVYALSALTHPTMLDDFAYHKKVLRVASSSVKQGFVFERLGDLDDVDFEHTTEGESVQRIAIDDDSLGIYPKANDTLSVWCYRKPVPMEADDDEPDGIEASFHYRVLVPRVVLRAMRVFPQLALESPAENTTALKWWIDREKAGLYGDGYSIGWVDSLHKQRGVTTRGPRLGSNISGGGWPVRRGR